MESTVQLLAEIFKKPKDHYSWDKQIAFAQRSSSIPLHTHREWISSLQFLRAELGEHFLQEIKHKHPLYQRITPKEGWPIYDLIHFVSILQQLKVQESNYQKVISKLASPKLCKREALPFIDIAAMFLPKGFSLYFQEETNDQQMADIALASPHVQEPFFIEVSALEESKSRHLLKENYVTLEDTFSQNWMPYTCSQLRYISPKYMAETISIIKELKKKAIFDQEIQHYQDDNIRLSIAPLEKLEELNQYIAVNDYRKGLLGAPLQFDETSRIISSKIRLKGKQIPRTQSGLIYIPATSLYFWGLDLDQTVRDFNRKLCSYPHLLGIVVFGYLIDEQGPVEKEHNDYYYGIKQMNEAVIRHLLFIRNRQFKGNLTPETIQLIEATFR